MSISSQQKKYPRQLSFGAHNIVIAVSETEAGKVFEGNTKSDIVAEAEKLKFANSINDLVVKYIRIDYHQENNWEILVMERLYPLDYRGIEHEKRELIFEVFEDELKELHRRGFVHRDLRKPSHAIWERYDNIFLTDRGLRLIDVGISALRATVGEKVFAKYVEIELEELSQFKAFFLSR